MCKYTAGGSLLSELGMLCTWLLQCCSVRARPPSLPPPWQVAAALCRSVLERTHGQAAWASRRLGYILAANHQHEEAVTAFQNALRVDDSRASLWEALGGSYYSLARYSAALRAFERAMQLDASPRRLYSVTQSAAVHAILGAPAEVRSRRLCGARSHSTLTRPDFFGGCTGGQGCSKCGCQPLCGGPSLWTNSSALACLLDLVEFLNANDFCSHICSAYYCRVSESPARY